MVRKKNPLRHKGLPEYISWGSLSEASPSVYKPDTIGKRLSDNAKRAKYWSRFEDR